MIMEDQDSIMESREESQMPGTESDLRAVQVVDRVLAGMSPLSQRVIEAAHRAVAKEMLCQTQTKPSEAEMDESAFPQGAYW